MVFLLLWKHYLASLLQSVFLSSSPCLEASQKRNCDAVAIFPSLERRRGEDTEGPQGLEAVAREALTGGDSLDPANLHPAAACRGQGTLCRWLMGICHPAPSSPAANTQHAADFCLLGCERDAGDFGSSPESSWGFWHPGSY